MTLAKSFAEGPSGEKPPTSSQIDLHASVPSHLAAEITFLKTLIRRAKAQHRTQLFLQRMVGVARVAQLVLRHVREMVLLAQLDLENQAGAGDRARDSKRKKGEILVVKMIKQLFDAHHVTSQIIDLHHFLPLQTTSLAIYARLFAMTVNIAIAWEMDIERLISGLYPDISKKGRNGMGGFAQGGVSVNGGPDAKASTSTFPLGGMSEEMGFELGEKIERSGMVSRPLSRALNPVIPRSVELSFNLSSEAGSDHGTRILAGAMKDIGSSPRISITTPAISSRSTSDTPMTIGTSRPISTFDNHLEPTSDPRSNNLSELYRPPRPRSVSKEEDLTLANLKTTKKKKRPVMDDDVEDDRLSKETTGETVDVKKQKRKKKKRDSMDDIFGF
ncbi:hypothetical protein IAR55_000959 [Kwoniella newhampshirensis]|uniref:Nucleolus and neural progenitor protein-like N-terminal domain-containing protein n=1 Tax=Kwoniella newhampshirensis TaxID=1651941 RepID=A0AAW0Z4D3_9TREE